MSEGSTEQYHPKAFISHATLDHRFVETFAADLRANGVDAWFSRWEIKPGDSIRAKIEEGLEGCEYFIIVLSKNSINRPWVKTELDAATIRRLNGKVRKIIPVRIEDCGDLPPMLGALLWEDFSNQPYESALKRVLDSVFGRDTRPPLQQSGTMAELAGKQHEPLRIQRPQVVPTAYRDQPPYFSDAFPEGISAVHEGDTAYRVWISPIPLGGGWTLHFDEGIERLEGEGFFCARISDGRKHTRPLKRPLRLFSVWMRLKEAKTLAAAFPFIIRYSDLDGRRYKSVCELYQRTLGFSVKFLRQETDEVDEEGSPHPG
jgi:hypothetical protein